MPMEFLDRLPVPNLRLYTTISFAILSCSIYYATQIIKDPAWRTNHTHIDAITRDEINPTDPRSLGMHFRELLECMVDEPVCIWVRLFKITEFENMYFKYKIHISVFKSSLYSLLESFTFF